MWIAISVVLMVIGLVGIIVCQKKQKTNPNAQALAFVFLILILAGAGCMLWKTGMLGGDPEMDRIISNEVTFTKARSQAIAEHIGKTWAGQKVVVITDPNVAQSPISKAAVESMQEFLKKAGMDVASVEALNIPESSPENPVPMENAVTAKLYNDIFNANKTVGVFVIMSQMPFSVSELKKMNCWSFDGKKQRVVVVSGEIMNLKGLIAAGKIGAAVAMKNTPAAVDPDKDAPKDLKAAFDVRYLLVTPQNVKQVEKDNPGLFGR